MAKQFQTIAILAVTNMLNHQTVQQLKTGTCIYLLQGDMTITSRPFY